MKSLKMNRSFFLFMYMLAIIAPITCNCGGSRAPLSLKDTLGPENTSPSVAPTSVSPNPTSIPPPTVSMTLNGFQGTVSINYGSTGLVSWTSTSSVSCSLLFGTATVSSQVSGTDVTIGPVTADTTLKITCTNSASVSASQTILVKAVLVNANLSVSSSTVSYGGTVNVSWNSQGTGCQLTDSLGVLSGVTGSSGTITTPALTASDVFTLTCKGTNPATVPVSVAPQASLTANGSTGPITVTSGSVVTLAWSSQNSGGGCVLKDTLNNTFLENSSGTTTVTVTAQVGYTLQCKSSTSAQISSPAAGPLFINVATITPPTCTLSVASINGMIANYSLAFTNGASTVNGVATSIAPLSATIDSLPVPTPLANPALVSQTFPTSGSRTIQASVTLPGGASGQCSTTVSINPTATVSVTLYQNGSQARPTNCGGLVDVAGNFYFIGCNSDSAGGDITKTFNIVVNPGSACNTLRIVLFVIKSGISESAIATWPTATTNVLLVSDTANTSGNSYMSFSKSTKKTVTPNTASIDGGFADGPGSNTPGQDYNWTITFPTTNYTIQNTNMSCS